MPLFGRRRGGGRKSKSRGTRRATRAMRRAAGRVSRVAQRAVKQGLMGQYRMGVVPKTAWGMWVARQFGRPAFGNPVLKYRGAVQEYDASRLRGESFGTALGYAYVTFDRLFSIRTSGVDSLTNAAPVAPYASDSFATWKEVTGPAIATGLDWGLSRLLGKTGRKLKVWKIQFLGSK